MEPVSWRDGVHVSGTPIWCDARRKRDVCFVSHAGALAAARQGQLITTAETVALLTRDRDVPAADTILPIPYGRPFTLGTLRLELFPSGYCVGSASLAISNGDHRVVYAGPVNPHGGGLAGPAEVRACQTLVVSAEYGSPEFSFPKVDDVAAEVEAACDRITEASGTPVLLVRSVAKALDVAARLAPRPTAAHRSIHRASGLLRRAGFESPTVRRFTGRFRRGEILLWLISHRDTLDKLTLPGPSEILLLSGAAANPRGREQVRADHGFPWSNEADRDALLAYIDATGADQIYLTNRYAAPLAEALAGDPRTFRPIGPPQQMTLF